MPWTTPETFTAGQTLTAASMNVISGNLDALGGAWTAYTPTWTNLTVGTSTQDFKYLNAGKLYVVRFKITLASGFSISGAPQFTLPDSASFNSSYVSTQPVGVAQLFDDGAFSYHASVNPVSGTLSRAQFALHNSSSTYAYFGGLNATTPITWAAGDVWSGTFMFEAA
jgi:hypothetical protein